MTDSTNKTTAGASAIDLDRLTTRELEVLILLSQGFTTQQIASALAISGSTARAYVSQAKAKVRSEAADNRLELEILGIEKGAKQHDASNPRSAQQPDDIGRPKPLAAAAALARLTPDALIDTRCQDLTAGVGLGELSDAGVVLGCLDSVHARMALLGRSALAGAPLVDGGTGSWGGEVRLRLDVDEPCYACALSAHQRGASDLPWSCADPPAGPTAASIVATSLVAAWMTLAALRILLGTPPEFRLVRIDGLDGRAGPVGVRRDPDCPHHRTLPQAEPVGVHHRQTVGELLAALFPGSEPVAWTGFPLPLRCVRCGDYEGEPPGAVDVARCPRCSALVRARSTERLRDADPGRRLRDLGIAPEEILTIRDPVRGVTWRRLRP